MGLYGLSSHYIMRSRPIMEDSRRQCGCRYAGSWRNQIVSQWLHGSNGWGKWQPDLHPSAAIGELIENTAPSTRISKRESHFSGVCETRVFVCVWAKMFTRASPISAGKWLRVCSRVKCAEAITAASLVKWPVWIFRGGIFRGPFHWSTTWKRGAGGPACVQWSIFNQIKMCKGKVRHKKDCGASMAMCKYFQK